MLNDAIKSKVPEAAPFPAGLYSVKDTDTSKVDEIVNDKKDIDENPEMNGDQIEN